MDGQEPQFANERRLLLALLLSSAVLFLTPYVFRYIYPQPDEPVVIEQTRQPEVPPAESRPAVVEPEQARPAPPPVELPVEETREEPRDATVVGRDVIFRFSNVAAIPVSVQLQNYRDEVGNPLELLPQGLPPEIPKPFQLSLFDEAASAELATAVFSMETPAALRGDIQAPAEVTFRYRSSRLQVVRTYRIPEDGFLISVSTDVRLDGVPVPARSRIGPGIGSANSPTGWMAPSGDFATPQLAYQVDGSVERKSSIDGPEGVAVHPDWVAFDSKYFSYLTFGPGIQQLQLVGGSWTESGADGQEVTTPLISADVEYVPGTTHEIFFGPKDLTVLRSIGQGLASLVDFGMFGILVEPLLFVLKAIYSVIGNYGWSIIILTFFINLLLMPIRYKQITSMKKMSVLQPQMKAIQDRYKKLDRSDPKRQEMQKEIMALYQKHGVNPLGGCLPLLVQMPFLFAFYRMLALAIELREAPFMFWITDLSRPDAYYVTPLVMGATMVAQQQMMPATGDASQRRMMMLMPILFTYFFLSVSSGLAIYFLFSNVFGMLFQWGMQRMSREEEVKPSSNPKGNSKKGKR